MTELRDLEEQRLSFLQGGGKIEVKRSLLRKEIEAILDPDSLTDWQLRRFQLDLLVAQSPPEAVDVICELLGMITGRV